MSIRGKNPYAFDISPQLRGVLEHNGLQAHISYDQNGQLQLVTMSHDTQAPKFFPISEGQAELLRDGGTNYTNKKAYQTFVGIVGKDYYVPGSYVAACNAGSPVNMGQYGYRINSGEYGYDPVLHAHHHMAPVPPMATPPFRPFRGPRFGPFDRIMGGLFAFADGGYHIRRINDRPFLYQDRPMVIERPDRRLKPGESKSFDYGFYDKGQQQSSTASQAKTQPLQDMQYKVDEIKLERPKGQSISLNDHDYQLPRLTGDKFQKLLASHGLVLDKNTNTLLVQSASEQVDIRLKVTDAQMKKILAPKVEYKLHGKDYNKGGVSLNERLAILNEIISRDFSDKVTFKQLESHDFVDIHLKPELEAKLNAQHEQAVSHATSMVQDPAFDIRDVRENYTVGFVDKWNSIAQVHGGMLGNKQGYYLPVKDGRRVAVGEIIAYNYGDGANKGGYRMTAVINNKIVSHDISQEDYMKFVNYDDKNRLKLFDKIFDEVKIKSISNGKFEDARYFEDYYNKIDDALKKGQTKDLTFGKYIYGFNIKYADDVATLNGHYSLVSDNMHAAITGAMAWYDTASKEYFINVRDDKDRGMWSFKITAEQFHQFKNASDDEKAKMLTTLIPFKDENGKNLKVVRTEQLPQSTVDKSLDNGRYNEKEAANARKVGFGADDGHSLDMQQEGKDKKGDGKESGKEAKELAGKALGFGAVAMTGKDVTRLANSEAQQVAEGRAMSAADMNALRQGVKTTLIGDASVDGENDALAKHHKLWKREGEHGRDTTVSSIAVARLRDAQGNVVEGKYKMSAVIDGNVISHEITQKDYNKFLAVNDYQRMKLFDKIFPEVQMKTNPDHKFNFGAAIMAALTVGLDVAAYALSAGRPQPRPDIYLDKNVYYKPGVVSPQAVSSAIFESEMHNRAVDEGLGNGRGMGV